MTELADRLKRQIDDGLSIRAISRKAGMSNSTVRRALAGQELDHSTIEKFAHYFKVPREEMYRMAGALPSMRNEDGQFNRAWLMSQIWTALSMLTESEQAKVLSDILRLAEQRNHPQQPQQPD